MVKGQKLATPTDPDEAAEYKARRKKNNESAAACRKRKELRIKEGEELKKRCEYLEAQLAEKDRENRRLLLALHHTHGPQVHHDQYHDTYCPPNVPAHDPVQHAPHVAYADRPNYPMYPHSCEHQELVSPQTPYGGRCISAPAFAPDGYGHAHAFHHPSEAHQMSAYHGEPYQPNNPAFEGQIRNRNDLCNNYPVQPEHQMNSPSSRYSLNSFSSTDSSAVPSPVHNPYQNTSLFQSPTQPARQFLATFLGPESVAQNGCPREDDEEDDRPGDFVFANYTERTPRQDQKAATTASAQDKLTPCSQYLHQAGATAALPVLLSDDVDMLSPLFEKNATLNDQPAARNAPSDI